MLPCRFVLLAAALAAAVCTTRADNCAEDDVWDRKTGESCVEQRERARLVRAAGSQQPAIETRTGHVVVTTGSRTANLTDMQSAADAKTLFDEVGTKVRPAAACARGTQTHTEGASRVCARGCVRGIPCAALPCPADRLLLWLARP